MLDGVGGKVLEEKTAPWRSKGGSTCGAWE
jgi:hypothetical protein